MPFLFSPNECVDMLLIFGECQRNARAAARLYQERFPDRQTPSHMAFSRIEAKMRAGVFPSQLKHDHHIATIIRNEQNEINVLAYVAINPHISIRTLADELGVSKSSVHRILKNHKYHAYKVHLVQALIETDFERRLEFVALMHLLQDDNPNIVHQILWSDESRFHNNGIVNRHNSHYWSSENPHWNRETGFQTMWGVNVWCGIFNGQIIGPFFFEGHLTGARYLEFLQNDLIELIENIPLVDRVNMWWQQDGAPAHNSRIVTTYLHEHFPNRWIGTTGPIRWPARSPDLSPLDFFLWGYLKSIVYVTPPTDVEDLKNRIREACNNITPAMIHAACSRELNRRLEACLTSDGHQFEHNL